MIKYNFKALLSDKEFKEGKKITYGDISKAIGVSRQTISKIATQKGYVTKTDIIEKLCLYFQCTASDLITILPDKDE